MDGQIGTTYRDLEIPGTAQILDGNGGLPKVRITTPDVVGEIYLHGAHDLKMLRIQSPQQCFRHWTLDTVGRA